MNIKVLLNSDKYVTSYAIVGDILGSVDAEVDLNELDNFYDNFTSYYFDNGCLIRDSVKQSEKEQEEKLNQLRLRRSVECFPVVNRGKLWYDNLTNEQLSELDSWYTSWLDVTKTEMIPVKPTWLI